MPAHLSREPEVLTVGRVEVALKRSASRRTLGLQVRGGVASAHAPPQMSRELIVRFLESKRDWLEKHVRQQQAQQPRVREWQDGDLVPFLGETLTLRLVAGTRVEQRGNELFVPVTDTALQLKKWTRKAALQPFTELVQKYASGLGASDRLGRVAVSDTRTRWGSCTAHGDIRLHWALSRAPLEVLHYVALHEAAHLLELNHSPRYWAHVKRLMPGHAAQRRWLKENGHTLLG
ncbi:M48 family metallopeptidase [Deinococcus fonticola]|uniref:M48 family metallopeptidase n=1 Tax=Deinococcus fonticola TaxID=2528713 RepID=UPI001F0E1D60|nr:SprT family zinc-dependent metalloprotease [Deinococcus fonticola]